MVVPGALDIVGMLFEETELRPVGELGPLLVVAPVHGVSEGGSHGRENKERKA